MAAGAAYFLWKLRGTGILLGNRDESASASDPVAAAERMEE